MSNSHISIPSGLAKIAGLALHLFHWFSWRSIRGRYLSGAVIVVVLLLGAAWFADKQVRQASDVSELNIDQREVVTRSLRNVRDYLWQTDHSLQTYMFAPSQEERSSVQESLRKALAEVNQLTDIPLITQASSDQEGLRELSTQLIALSRQAEIFMDIRATPEKVFPAMPIMLEKMLPAQTAFNTAATLAMNEAAGELHNPAQAEIHLLFSEARYAATQMIGAFRVWVANRFGVFGDVDSSMRAQAVNIKLYGEMVERNLTKLSALDRQGRLGLQQGESIEKMWHHYKEWTRAYKEAAAIYTSERWRADVPLMRETILPLEQKIWTTSRTLHEAIERHSARETSALTGMATRLSRSIWVLALFSMMVVSAGYLLFEFAVRRPIARVAKALMAEAAGTTVVVPPTPTAETQDLIAAFDHMRRQVRSRQERLETVLDNAAEGIITFDDQGIVERFNKAAERLFGFSEQEIVGRDIALLISPAGNEKRKSYLKHFMRTEIQRLIGHEGEVTGRHKDGTNFAMALKVSKILVEGRHLYTGLVADISERKAMLDHLKNMAEHDGLTGLYNRSYFQQELERVVERARRTGTLSCALLYLDLDNFKYVNDTASHAAGDRLLIEVASILQKRARKSDLIARFGGDEFTVLLYDVTSELAKLAAESFRKKLADFTFRHEGEQVNIGCSIGVTVIGAKTVSAEELLSQADLACHLAKRNGRNQVHMFVASDAQNVTAMSLDMGWSRRIKDAIEHNRFALACQPIISTHTRATDGYEVLIRMLDESNGLIMPAGFLPSAERFGLASDIDKWVIIHAIETLAAQRKTMPALRYSINLSGQTLTNFSVCDLIQKKLWETELEPSALTFEVTETVAIADMTAAEVFLSRLQEMGCKTALDDFGSGMSSFAYLKDLPVDIVKIDGRFVKNLAANPVDQAMVKAMNDIAHALGKQTVAEFVENEASFQLLVEYGVDFGQGYHLGRPDVSLPCQAIADHADAGVACELKSKASAAK